MKTTTYNPSPLEVQLANAIQSLSKEIEAHLKDNTIAEIKSEMEKENPMLRLKLVDKDGDPHEVAIKIIQVPDKF